MQHNLDVLPEQHTIDAYASVAPLVVNPIVNDAFAQREEAAKEAKNTYHGVGRLAILLIAAGALFSVAEALILPEFAYTFVASAIFAGLSVVGLLLQLYILATRQKSRWLVNRFAAERLRSIKFCGYIVADNATDLADLQRRADDFYMKAVAQLSNDLNAELVALKKFSPVRTVDALTALAPAAPAPPASQAISATAREAYLELRVRYQGRFAANETARLQSGKRALELSSGVLYLIGAVVVVLALASRFLGWHTALIDFIAVGLFILGLSMAILENASLAPDSQSRYERYSADCDEIERSIVAKQTATREAVASMEGLALRELDAFCRAAEMISYRL